MSFEYWKFTNERRRLVGFLSPGWRFPARATALRSARCASQRFSGPWMLLQPPTPRPTKENENDFSASKNYDPEGLRSPQTSESGLLENLPRPVDPNMLRTESEKRRNRPVRSLAERRRLLRERRRRQQDEEQRRSIQDAYSGAQDVKDWTEEEEAEAELVPIVQASADKREAGQDYWIDLRDVTRKGSGPPVRPPPRISRLMGHFLNANGQTNDTSDDVRLEDEEYERLIAEIKRRNHAAMRFKEVVEEVVMRPGESVEDAFGRSQIARGKELPTEAKEETNNEPLFGLEPRVESAVQPRGDKRILIIRQYVPQTLARILELRERRARRKVRTDSKRISKNMQDLVRAEISLPYKQNWIAYVFALVTALAILTWLFGQSTPIIEIPDL